MSGPVLTSLYIYTTLSLFLREMGSTPIAYLLFLAYRFLSPTIQRGTVWVETADCHRPPCSRGRSPGRVYHIPTYFTMPPIGGDLPYTYLSYRSYPIVGLPAGRHARCGASCRRSYFPEAKV